MPLDVAEQEVQAAINAANNLLPNDLPQPPVYSKVNPADTPVLTLAVTSETLPLPQVTTWSTRASRRSCRSCPASAWSASPAASGRRCASRSTRRRWPRTASTCRDVRARHRRRQRQPAEGQLRRPAARVHASTPTTSCARPRTIADLIVAYRDGAPIRLARRRRRRRRRREPPPGGLGQRRCRRCSSTSSASPAPTSSRSSTASRQLLPQLTRQPAVDASTSRVLSDRTETIRASVERRAARADVRDRRWSCW